MRNRISGLILMVWGVLVLARHFLLPHAQNVSQAYEAGSNMGAVLAAILAVGGLILFIRSFQS